MKELIRRIILAAGYEVRHKSLAPADPFRQQAMLLDGIPEPTVFDVGANKGQIVEKYRCAFPHAKIFAFEPFPEVYRELTARVSGDKRVFPCKVALGSRAARKALRVNASSPTNSLLDTEDAAASFWGKGLMETTGTVDVDIVTIDEFCRDRRIEHIDVLKIDTQGTELEVLKGAAGLLSSGRITLIYTEMIVVPSYKGQSKPHELMGFLESVGYDLSGLYNLWSRNDGRLLQMDAIFVRSERCGKAERNLNVA